MVKIKICGNTNLDDVTRAIELGADFIGFIFAPSKRRISPANAADIIQKYPRYSGFVGVFVNEPIESIKTITHKLNLKWVQLHGDETAQDCAQLQKEKIVVIKAFSIQNQSNLIAIKDHPADYYLLDAFSESARGGTGTTFDWNLLSNHPHLTPKLFLAGGLRPDNVQDAIRLIKPFAVDAVSGIERKPGIKDHILLEKFIINSRTH